MNVLIIEDESRSAKELAGIINKIDPTLNILAVLVSVEQSINWLSSNPQPDLIFSDIQLADGLSFEIYKTIKIRCPIIFCTAFDEYLMEAFDTNAISYLLKPISKDKVEKAIDKLKLLQKTNTEYTQIIEIETLLKNLKSAYKSTLLVSSKEKIIPLQVKDIAYLCLDATLLQVCTMKNQKYFLTSSLDEMEKIIDPELFFRANRQFLINRNSISNVERFFSRKLVIKLTMDTPETIMISKVKSVEFLRWLEA
jgi:two-component system, LytTR family, response regulator LytT